MNLRKFGFGRFEFQTLKFKSNTNRQPIGLISAWSISESTHWVEPRSLFGDLNSRLKSFHWKHSIGYFRLWRRRLRQNEIENWVSAARGPKILAEESPLESLQWMIKSSGSFWFTWRFASLPSTNANRVSVYGRTMSSVQACYCNTVTVWIIQLWYRTAIKRFIPVEKKESNSKWFSLKNELLAERVMTGQR